MIRTGWILSVAVLIILLGLFLLSNKVRAEISQRDQDACADDAKRFCTHAIADTPFTVAACFRAHLAQLTPKCRAVLKKHGIQL